MKKAIALISLFSLVLHYGQSLTSTENYIHTRTYLAPVTTETPGAAQYQSVQYLDGLGRPFQEIAVKATPGGQDLVKPILYDQNGKISKTYLPLPAATQNGALHSGVSETTINAHYGVGNAYFQVDYELSPLLKVLETAAPGTEWQLGGNTRKNEYLANADGEVKRLKATTVWNGSANIYGVSLNFNPDDDYTANGYYKSHTLFKTITKDEDGNETHQFMNSNRQTILIREINTVGSTTEFLDTYYIYDDRGNLAFVIPPKATFSTIAELQQKLDLLCYQYKYDKFNRLAEKKLPGRNYWEYVVYDRQGRPALSQDANQHNNSWSFVKYDAQSRPVYNGIYVSTASRAQLQSVLDNAPYSTSSESRTSSSFTANGQNIYYTNIAFPTANIKMVAVHYYDEYPADSPTKPVAVLNADTLNDAPVSITSNGYPSSRSTRSLPTASMVKNIENDAWTQAYVWYDQKARVVGTHSVNHLGGSTITEKELHFSGAVLEAKIHHKRLDSDAVVTVKERFEYDSQMRPQQHYHQVNSEPEVLLAEYTYNELGQVSNKTVGNGLQSIDYEYNIRGWLTKINEPKDLNGKLFGYEIKYTNPEEATARYNGNIAEVDWAKATGYSEPTIRRYSYSYDAINRLTNANFSEPNTAFPNNEFYNENISYDLNGNILHILRNAPSFYGNYAEQIDELSYDYNGNRLIAVSDGSGNPTGYEGGGNPMEYDANGNMLTMPDKYINQIGYNYLNLSNAIGIHENKFKFLYLYRADGTKLRKLTNLTQQDGEFATITEYIDGFHYLTTQGTPDNNVNPVYFAYEQEAFIEEMQLSPNETALRFFPTAEGFYDFENNEYIYQYKDHLGNVRLSYKDDGYPLVVDSNDYYPFGMSFVRNSEEDAHFGTGTYFNYKYNGKELQETGMYDYGWRQYMSDVGRWYGMDQLSEMYHSLSPYNYVANNPVNFVDPDGRCIKNEQGDRCDDSPGGANNPYLIEEVVITKKKPEKQSEFIDDGWNGFFGIGNLGSSGGGSSGIGGNGGGWGIYGGGMSGGGAPSPIKLRPVDDIEEQMNRKQQLEYERLQKRRNDALTAIGIGNEAKTGLIKQAGKVGGLSPGTQTYLKVFNGLGTAIGAVNAYNSVNKAFDNPTPGNILNATISTGVLFIRINPAVAIGLGVMDVTGLSDYIYGNIDHALGY